MNLIDMTCTQSLKLSNENVTDTSAQRYFDEQALSMVCSCMDDNAYRDKPSYDDFRGFRAFWYIKKEFSNHLKDRDIGIVTNLIMKRFLFAEKSSIRYGRLTIRDIKQRFVFEPKQDWLFNQTSKF